MSPSADISRRSAVGRAYRTRAVSWPAAIGAIFLVLVLGSALFSPDNNPRSLSIAIFGLVIAAWLGLRVARCGVVVEDGGVRVVNPVSTVQLKWSEIISFEFRVYGSCQIKRVHGRSVSVVGIQQSAWAMRRGQPDTQAARQITELNMLLAAQRADSQPVIR
jgi:hypothetical protein